MTRQPAVQLGVLFPVALDAEFHLEFQDLEAVHVGHLAVAFGAVQFSPADVRVVLELGEIRNVEDPHPRYGGVGVEVPLFLNELWMLRNDIFVAVEALFHRRESRVRGPLHIGVTESAVDLFDPRVDAMAEVDGLLRTEVPFRVDGEEIKGGPAEHQCRHQEEYTEREAIS